MSTLPPTIYWAVLFPVLTIFIATFTALQEIVRNSAVKRGAILVPVSGVLSLAAIAYSLAQSGAFCAFCE